VNYIRLSSDFPFFHRNIFGLYKNYQVSYTDTAGNSKTVVIPYFQPVSDTAKSKKKPVEKRHKIKYTQREKLDFTRSLQYDSSYVLMTINDFSKGHLKGFFRKSFREMREKKVKNLVIDIRANGGGDIIKSVFLTKFLRNTPFKVSDTAEAVSRSMAPYARYISHGFFNNIGLLFVCHKEKDGRYHFGYWERHTFKPKRKNHFNGNTFILTNGLTFSASSIFCNAVKGQPNIKLVGEQTGGGWYGNSGIMIPDITLPNTKIRVRLPFFRLVQYQHVPLNGTGVLPDIFVGPDWRDILKGVDTKIERVKEIIREKKDGSLTKD
jgi:C-terminal processing protease CtpA/Prc